MYEKHMLANAGTTGNNTHDSKQVGNAYYTLAFQFVVEAVGGTPTVTYKFQGSHDGTNWYDLAYVTDSTDTTATATRTATAVGAQTLFLANPAARAYRYVRCVTTLNTNVTYRAEAYTIS